MHTLTEAVSQSGRQAGKQTLSTDAFSEILRICYTSKLSPFASTSMPPSSLFIITLVSFLIFCRCWTLLSSLFSFFFFLVWFSYLLLLWLLFLFVCDSHVSLIWQFCLYAMHKYAAAHVRLFTSCFNIALEWIYVYSETGCSNNKAFLSQFLCSYFNDDFFFLVICLFTIYFHSPLYYFNISNFTFVSVTRHYYFIVIEFHMCVRTYAWYFFLSCFFSSSSWLTIFVLFSTTTISSSLLLSSLQAALEMCFHSDDPKIGKTLIPNEKYVQQHRWVIVVWISRRLPAEGNWIYIFLTSFCSISFRLDRDSIEFDAIRFISNSAYFLSIYKMYKYNVSIALSKSLHFLFDGSLTSCY